MTMSSSFRNPNQAYTTLKLRSACDACHQAKVKCSRGASCLHCRIHNQECRYSYTARIGKPKGSRNRKTLAGSKCTSSNSGCYPQPTTPCREVSAEMGSEKEMASTSTIPEANTDMKPLSIDTALGSDKLSDSDWPEGGDSFSEFQVSLAI
jgi:Zn(2)-Cys(6) binuclear cluster domain-containing protein